MTDLPILFSSPMSSAILAGRKTQTRRAIMGSFLFRNQNEPMTSKVRFAVGDRLWVREPYYQFGHWIPQGRTKTGRVKWEFKPNGPAVFDLPPDTPIRASRRSGFEHILAWHKRLGRFMPRAYSRLTLTVTDVRVMRLQEISEADARAEGAPYDDGPQFPVEKAPPGANFIEDGWDCARDWFADLWGSINGAGSWEANPFVAAYTFTVEKRNIDDGR